MLKVLGWLWFFTTLMFELALAVAILWTAETRAETIVLASLVLIYVNVANRQMMLGWQLTQTDDFNAQRFLRLSELLNDPKQDEYVAARREAQGAREHEQMKMLVAAGARVLEFALALAMMLGALMR